MSTLSLMLLLVGGCSQKNPHYDPKKPHHRPNGFVNSNGDPNNKPLRDVLRWSWQRWRAGLPHAPTQRFQGYAGIPMRMPDLEQLQHNCQSNPQPYCQTAQVLWMGHTSMLLQSQGLNVLIDPHFSKRASPLSWFGPKRKAESPVQLAQLPSIDVVLISHNHYDHLDLATVQALAQQASGEPLFLVPLGLEAWFRRQGIHNVQSLDWWEQHIYQGVTFNFVPAHHWSSRSPFDRNASLWGGWVTQAEDGVFYYAGDTGWSADFAAIGQRFSEIDLAAIPVGAYAPRWFMAAQHINPTEAVQVFQALQPRRAFGVHWGTFELTDEALDQPMIDLELALAQAGVDTSLFVMPEHGQVIPLR
ncbi:MAG: MBL fold metallo-hydrolase [Pseudomonadota bacterium]|nr:MBL fold metallo-hydrolase [Pseudomonadota bacterium]